MQADFWHQKWETGDIAFHEKMANPLLVNNLDKLRLPEGARIFLPLCGKTLDIAWLLDKGYQVVGAELSELAILQLFEELKIEPEVTQVGKLSHYHFDGLDMLVGDIFDIDSDILGKVDAVYDRAALVALPPQMREKYSQHLMQITKVAPQLVICFEYDQQIMQGPPFSVSQEEVERHYANNYQISLADKQQYYAKIRGKIAPLEEVWLLKP